MSKVLIAKTALDGHWRGVTVVSRALSDAGFEVILGGMSTADAITAAAIDEDVDLVGLNVGGRSEIVDRIAEMLREAGYTGGLMAGGTIPPPAARRLREKDIAVFPPGSALDDIVEWARGATAGESGQSVDT